MRNGKIILVFTAVIIYILLLSDYNICEYNGYQYLLSEPKAFNIEYIARITNITNKTLNNIELIVPVVTDERPWQFVRDFNFKKRPSCIRKDKKGNIRGIYRISRLMPGESYQIEADFKAQINKIEFEMDHDKCIADNDEYKIFTEPEPFIESDSLLIRKLSDELIKKEINPYYFTVRFFDFITENIVFDLNIVPEGALMSLKKKKASCGDSALLYAALCRTRKIPARYCAGIFLGNTRFIEKRSKFIANTHAWVNYYFPFYGWIMADPTLGRYNEITRYYSFAQQRSQYVLLWKDNRDPFEIKWNKDEDIIRSIKPEFLLWVTPDDIFTNPNMIYRSLVRDNLSFYFDTMPLKQKKEIQLSKYEKFIISNNFNEFFSLLKKNGLNGENTALINKILKNIIVSDKYNNKDMFIKFIKDGILNYNENVYLSYSYGFINIFESEYSIAVSEFEKCIKKGLNVSQVYNNLGYIYLITKEIIRAQDNFIKSIELDPYNVNPYINIMNLLMYLQKNDLLLSLSLKFIEKRPEDPRGYAMCSEAYDSLKNHKKAVYYIKKAISIEPENGNYYGSLGLIFLNAGDKKSAQEALRKAISLGIKK